MDFNKFNLGAPARYNYPKEKRRSVLAFFLYTISLSIALGAQIPANTVVQNIATMSYTMNGTPDVVNSNLHTFRVDELIDLTVVGNNPTGVLVLSPALEQTLSFTLTNVGNGDETFSLSILQLGGDQFDVSDEKIYLDANNNGTFEDGTDPEYVGGINDPTIAPDGTQIVFVVSDIPAGLIADDEARVGLYAAALTGTGPAGTNFNGQGTGGVDATLGVQGGDVTTQNRYIVTSPTTASIVKSQSVLDPDGGTTPIPNAIITYTLTVNFSGPASSPDFTNMLVTDAIPAGTEYVPGSLELDSVALGDTAGDSDPGVFNGSEVVVTLGTVPVNTTRIITFKVRIL